MFDRYETLLIAVCINVAVFLVLLWKVSGLGRRLRELAGQAMPPASRDLPPPTGSSERKPASTLSPGNGASNSEEPRTVDGSAPAPPRDEAANDADALRNVEHPARSEEQLAQQNRDVEREARAYQRLYLLMKGSLLRRERALAGEVTEATGGHHVAGNAPTKSTSEEPSPSERRDQRHIARRMARVMVADLFLYNPQVVERATSEEELRAVLDKQYRAARLTYEARVPESIRVESDHLELEYERALRARAQALGADPVRTDEAGAERKPVSEPPPPKPRDGKADDGPEHQSARRTARVMIADVFLYAPSDVTAKTSVEQLRKLLAPHYHAARETYDERVPARVRRHTDYLSEEFERRLRESANTDAAESSHSSPLEEIKNALDPTGDDDDYLAATRLARRMVADLFLDNWNLVEAGVWNDTLREVLDQRYRQAHRAFQARVAKHVCNETDYFELQFEQLLWEAEGVGIEEEIDRLVEVRLDAVVDGLSAKGTTH